MTAIFCICRMNLVSAFISFTILYFSRFWLVLQGVKLMTLLPQPTERSEQAMSAREPRSGSRAPFENPFSDCKSHLPQNLSLLKIIRHIMP